jgi:hypothetical protein
MTTLPRAAGAEIKGSWGELPSRLHSWPLGPPPADPLAHEGVGERVGERRVFAGHPAFVGPEPERPVTTRSYQQKVTAAIKSGRGRGGWAGTVVMETNIEQQRQAERVRGRFTRLPEEKPSAEKARERVDEGRAVSFKDGLALLAERFAEAEAA